MFGEREAKSAPAKTPAWHDIKGKKNDKEITVRKFGYWETPKDFKPDLFNLKHEVFVPCDENYNPNDYKIADYEDKVKQFYEIVDGKFKMFVCFPQLGDVDFELIKGQDQLEFHLGEDKVQTIKLDMPPSSLFNIAPPPPPPPPPKSQPLPKVEKQAPIKSEPLKKDTSHLDGFQKELDEIVNQPNKSATEILEELRQKKLKKAKSESDLKKDNE